MIKITALEKVNFLNKATGYSNNRTAYELSKILKERSIQKTTPQQEASAQKEFSQIFSSKSSPHKNKEELANQFRDRFLKQMGVEVSSQIKPSKKINVPTQKAEKDKKKLELLKIEQIRKAIPKIIQNIIFKGKSKDTNNKSFETPIYKASLKLDGDNQKLTLERKNNKSQPIALEAIKKGKEEFEITNNSIYKEELEEIQTYIKAQSQISTQIKDKNKNSNLEM